MKIENHISICFVILLAIWYFCTSVIPNIVAVSPSFVRQEISDEPKDWQLWNPSSNTFVVPTHNGYSVRVDTAKDISECKNENIDKS